MASASPDEADRSRLARRVLRLASHAALATLDAETGAPYASIVSVATAIDGAPIALMSRLAQHWRNIEADPRVSLLFDPGEGDEDPLARARVSVMGRAAITEDACENRRFRARHASAFYAEFADFACLRIEPDRAHLIAGFGLVEWIEGERLVLDAASIGTLGQAEPEIVSHMNRDHGDAVHLYATMLMGAEPAAWALSGLDPEGVDIASPTERLRLDFTTPVSDAQSARAALVDMAREARAKGDT